MTVTKLVERIAQLVRAPDCGSGGRGFKSRYAPQSLPSFPPRRVVTRRLLLY